MSGPAAPASPVRAAPGNRHPSRARTDHAPAANASRPLPGPAVLGLAFAGYLALSIALWWQVWSTHPSTVTLCGCEDPSITTWFLAWPADAIAHGTDPFFSTLLFHPTGVNLLSNTGMLAVGIPLAPVTWIWGPVATLNVASTLAPALSAWAMCWLLRRWVRWSPAAVVGGLLFGFSPFVVSNLAMGHLDMAVLVLVPLMVACADELLVRQGRSAIAVGGVLGCLLALQFFVSTEVLVISLVTGVVAVVLVAGYAMVGHRSELAARAPHAARGLGVAAAVGAVLLAYPVWFALAGPAHLSGRIWPPGTSGSSLLGSGPIDLPDLWHLRFAQPSVVRFFAGYQGPALPSPAYLGLGVLVVLVAAVLVWRTDRRLWCFGILGAVAVVLGVGPSQGWDPWRAFTNLPVLEDVITGRFMVVVTLCAAVMLAVAVDRTREAVLRAARRRPTVGDAAHAATGPAGAAGAADPPPARPAVRLAAGVAALAVAAVALVPPATALVANVPLTMEPVVLPRWFTAVAPSLPPGRVVMTFPLPVTGGSAMTWQAVERFPFALATGAGPQSVPERAGPERAGQAILVGAGSLFATLAPPTAAGVGSVRRAIAGWRVTTVVVPDPAVLVPRTDRTAATAWALGYLTLAVGRAPRLQAGAWEWSGARAPAARRAITRRAFDRCTAPSRLRALGGTAVATCVLRHSVPVPGSARAVGSTPLTARPPHRVRRSARSSPGPGAWTPPRSDGAPGHRWR